jgi:hypothetical protein
MSQTTVELIKDTTVSTVDLADSAVTTAKIADASVTKAKLADDIKVQAYPFTTSGFSMPI